MRSIVPTDVPPYFWTISGTSVGKGRPDRLTSPPGGSERSERGGMFHVTTDTRERRSSRSFHRSRTSSKARRESSSAARRAPRNRDRTADRHRQDSRWAARSDRESPAP